MAGYEWNARKGLRRRKPLPPWVNEQMIPQSVPNAVALDNPLVRFHGEA